MKVNSGNCFVFTAGCASLLTLALAPAVQAIPPTVLTVYSTGQTSAYSATTQTQFSSGSSDTHWTIISNPTSAPSAAATVTKPNTAWLANSTTSQWLSNVADSTAGTSAGGNYDYQTTFNIGSNIDLSTVVLQFQVAGDNAVTSVLLNGTNTGIATYGDPTGVATTGFAAFSGTQTINASNANGAFKAGSNTLDFVVNNSTTTPNPAGFRLLFTSATGTPTPEPGSLTLIALGAGGMLVAWRRRRNSAA